MTGPATIPAGTVPVGPMLSMFDPIYVGIDEFGHPVYIRVIYKNLLASGQPGGGKSGLMNTLTAHAALSARSRLVLYDGKRVELGMWDDIESSRAPVAPTTANAPRSTISPASSASPSRTTWRTPATTGPPVPSARSAIAELYVGEQVQRVGRELLRREVKTETSEAPLPLPELCVAALKLHQERRKPTTEGLTERG